jgi:hypothetical protein
MGHSRSGGEGAPILLRVWHKGKGYSRLLLRGDRVQWLCRPKRYGIRRKAQGARHKEKISFLLLFLPCALCLEPLPLGPESLVAFQNLFQYIHTTFHQITFGLATHVTDPKDLACKRAVAATYYRTNLPGFWQP